MSLYQPSVLKHYLKLQDSEAINKAYTKYKRYFLNPTIQDNIRSSKEEEYQSIFLTELFVNVLDYTLKPKANFNLVAEYKNQNNARKADNKLRVIDGLVKVPTLTKKDEFEWLDLFEDKKQKAQALQTQTNQTDKEIDQMVYELYGLTEVEIAIVENS
ncbi:hypothetical protein [Mesoflavibacter zeaxanthinifaciens]|uniref:hypothetical protein n=1 Tax=Mesoflavibacter zeaxanthinifaciens TaxID=393060 RepID=UPI003A8DE460